MTVRLVSHGGGVQTTALLVLAAQGRIDYRSFVFANVGDDSEHPATLAYLRDVAAPFAEAHGIELVEVRRQVRGAGSRSLLDQVGISPRDIPIPVRMEWGGFGRRNCTQLFKIRVVARVARERGATIDDPAEVALGISVDEMERAKPGVDERLRWTVKVYPLLDLGLTRAECRRVIADAGLPSVPKSACWFCPFSTTAQWRALRRDYPERWADAVALDAELRARSVALGRNPVGLAHPTIPLDRVLDDQLELFGADCESGYCMT